MKAFLFLILIYCNICRAQYSSKQAMAYTQRAILAYPYIKTQTKRLERTLISYIPLDKEYIIVTGTVGVAVIKGRIETRPIRKLDIEMLGGKARPDVFWDFRDKDAGMSLNLTWGF